jgi:hypothetical protein
VVGLCEGKGVRGVLSYVCMGGGGGRRRGPWGPPSAVGRARLVGLLLSGVGCLWE